MIQICPKDCPHRRPGCHGSCPDYLRRLAEYHAEQAYNREQKARISDSIQGVLGTLPVDKRNCHVTRTPGRQGKRNRKRRGEPCGFSTSVGVSLGQTPGTAM